MGYKYIIENVVTRTTYIFYLVYVYHDNAIVAPVTVFSLSS